MNTLAQLWTLAVVLSTVLLIAKVIVSRSRRPSAGPSPAVHDLYEAAFLNGGPARVADTALTALHSDGRVLIGGPGIISVQRPQANDPVERAVLQALSTAPSGALHAVREAVMHHPAVQEIGDGLAQRGLLVRPADSRPVRRWGLVQGVGCFVALPVSILLTVLQYMSHDSPFDMPFPFVLKMLPGILLGGISGLVVAAAAANRITRAGRRAAQAFRAANAYLLTPPYLVANRGLRALPDPVLQAQLIAAARLHMRGRRTRSGFSGSRSAGYVGGTAAASGFAATTVWCADAGPGHTSCGGGGGGGCGGSGSSCGGGSSCGSSGSGCGSSGGSSCGSSS
ncbi:MULTISPECIES: TIGR04222 domain-containing membrane protein [unclassified Streptomyces]|uniref:TIGR04222 domain-containing membrane protein n=1 Tax=unclassified Streptomyces TaxID=2593676 RepID=UPI00081EFBCE|nr:MULTISPECIES: TIGR04222 domain-containing membrane protein [unclassified Streptomyces]MYR92413.1 TIGR04222 domain-containing membrane protein [Streptomyces sp. SID4937]SCD33445.1 TIGR04222 domain-containing protein [Streptomyces sp. ScaeMP-e83]